jgi:hypothetical protein
MPVDDGSQKKGKLVHTIPEAARESTMSRAYLYKEIGAGRLRILKFGARTGILDEDLRAWLVAHRR